MLVIRKKNNHKQIKASGYVSTGGLGEFDPTIYEEVELDELPEGWEQAVELPIATGEGLIRFINETTESSLNNQKAFVVVSKLPAFLLFLQQARCNPMSRQTFDDIKALFETGFSDGEKVLLSGLIDKWTETVRFV